VKPTRLRLVARHLLRKSATFFQGLYDSSMGFAGAGYFPTPGYGQGVPPVNIVRSQTGKDITPKGALSISAAWACVWLISETVASLPFILNRRERPGSGFGAPALDDPLYTVLGFQPNPQMSSIEFWTMMLASRSLWGNGYAKKTFGDDGRVIMLDPFRPELMTPYRDEGGLIRYRYYAPILGMQDYAATDIFHFKGRSLDGLVGLSPIAYARNSLGIAMAGDQATAETFKNGMRAGGFVQAAGYLKKDEREEIRGSVRKFTTGGEHAGGVMVLEGGMKFEALTMNPQDVQLLASRQFAVEDICRWYNVPPVLIGHAAAGVTTWGTGIENLMLGWLGLSLRPIIRQLEQGCAIQLIRPKDQNKLYLTIDTDDLLGADSAARAALYSTYSQNGVMTRNEIRAREDLPPAEGGDVLTVQSNLIPLDKIETMGGQQTVVAPPDAQKPPPKLRLVT
jgi:HK97 family phage portal protein